MSALNLLSVSAPANANVPQGPSGEAASGFQDLLASLVGETDPAPEGKPGGAKAALIDEAKVEAPTVA